MCKLKSGRSGRECSLTQSYGCFLLTNHLHASLKVYVLVCAQLWLLYSHLPWQSTPLRTTESKLTGLSCICVNTLIHGNPFIWKKTHKVFGSQNEQAEQGCCKSFPLSQVHCPDYFQEHLCWTHGNRSLNQVWLYLTVIKGKKLNTESRPKKSISCNACTQGVCSHWWNLI